mmetsp:Transcript_1044/g.1355  ORF Transcript_1044/g.1355 Transcript_1044/m.1355 type:complete len:80 (-) Transcript_1044:376-615(-)
MLYLQPHHQLHPQVTYNQRLNSINLTQNRRKKISLEVLGCDNKVSLLVTSKLNFQLPSLHSFVISLAQTIVLPPNKINL